MSSSHTMPKRSLSSPSPSNAVVVTTSQALMPPPPPRKRIKRPAEVLDEDTYTNTLSQIIARDYFPGLIETEAQQEYLESLESQDQAWIASAGQRLQVLRTPRPGGGRARGKRGTSLLDEGPFGTAGSTPKIWVGETPSPHSISGAAEKTKKVDTNLSLSAFQAKYTSEDNESFNKLLDKQNEQRAQKYAWMWNGNQILSARRIAYRRRQEQIEAKKSEQEKSDGKPLLAIEARGERKAVPDTWKSKPNNNFMFTPDSIEDSMPTLQKQAEEASRAGPKAIVHDNTRLPDSTAFFSAKVPDSPSLSAVNEAIAGHRRLSASEIGEYTGNETPKVNGYAFVDSEPSPEPEPDQISAIDWSNLPLGRADATPNPFDIKERSNREELHYRMVDRVAKSKRAHQIVSESKTPVPKFMSSPRPGKGELTPAGQRLLGTVGGRTPDGSVWGNSNTPRLRKSLSMNWVPKVKPLRNQK